MQMSLSLATFEYQNGLPVRTTIINGEPWFYATDVCSVLEIGNPRDAVSTLDDDEKMTVGSADGHSGKRGGAQSFNVVSESGLYALIFKSRKPEAKKFRKWVTRDVLPQIRKNGIFALQGAGTPAFVRRFNDNWDRVDTGYFSVISELFIRIYGRFEQLGHQLAEKGMDGKEIRPDVSVGRTFSGWLKSFHPNEKDNHKKYQHLINGIEVEARQYPYAMLPLFIEFVDTVWMREHAPSYLKDRDPVALDLLPKLLPSVKPDEMKRVVNKSQFYKMKEAILKGEVKD